MEESLNVCRPGGEPVEVLLVLVKGLDELAGVGGEGLQVGGLARRQAREGIPL